MAKKKGAMMALEERKKFIDRSDEQMSISEQCRLLEINRSTLYYTPAVMSDQDMGIMKVIDELYTEDPTRGTRRMSMCLKKRGYNVGRCKTRSLMRIMRIKTIYCRPRTTISDPAKYKYPYLLRNIKIEHPNQVWALDISYIPMPKGFMFLTAIMDLYSRYIVGWSLSNTMGAEWVVETLKTAVNRHGKPNIINSDQGSQFTSDEYVNYIKSLETVKISMDGKGRATDNAFIERFFRTIKYDKLYIEVPCDGIQLNRCCTEYINFYNARREHSELNYETPGEWYKLAA